jgi:hypothetical protein
VLLHTTASTARTAVRLQGAVVLGLLQQLLLMLLLHPHVFPLVLVSLSSMKKRRKTTLRRF